LLAWVGFFFVFWGLSFRALGGGLGWFFFFGFVVGVGFVGGLVFVGVGVGCLVVGAGGGVFFWVGGGFFFWVGGVARVFFVFFFFFFVFFVVGGGLLGWVFGVWLWCGGSCLGG